MAKLKIGMGLFAVLVILVLFGIYFYAGGGQFATVSSFSGDRVVLPIFGSFKCEAGTGNEFINSIPMGSSQYKDYFGLVLPYNTISLSTIQSEIGANAIANIVKKCDAYSCEIRNVNDNSFTCPSGYSLIYKFSRGGVIQKEQTALNLGSSFQISVLTDKLQSSIMTLNESEEYSVQASCVSQFDVSFAGLGYRRLSALIPQTKITSFIRQKEIYAYYDGSPHKVNNTIGCAFQTLTKGNITDTGANINVDTTTQKFSFVDISGNIVSVSESGYPSTLNVGETYTFIYKWQDYPAVFTNIINANDGKKYVLGMANRNLYLVTSYPVNGVNYYVPTSFIKHISDSGNYCISDEECNIKYQSASLGCNIKDLTFQCSISKECTTDIDCQPNSGYLTENSKYYSFTKTCVLNKCQTNKVLLVCNPSKNYPDNGCSVDKPVCVDGQYCKVKEIPISECPGECCLSGGTYKQKDCPTNYECKVSNGFVGSCMKKGFCGNAICESELGENTLTCVQDCLSPEPPPITQEPLTCQWYEVKQKQQTSGGAAAGFWNWLTGADVGVTEVCVFNPWIAIAVAIFGIGVIAIFIFKPSKGRGRR